MRLTFPLLIAFGIAVVVGIPVVIALISAIGLAMPWLIIVFVIWAALAAGRHPRRQHAHDPRWGRHYWRNDNWISPAPAPARPTRAAPAPRIDQQSGAPTALPIDVQLKIEQIKHKTDVLLGYASRFPPFSQDLYIVRQTATEYLPRTVKAYLALPPVDSSRVLPSTGRTALEELKSQLDLLDSKLDEIATDLQRRDVDALLANRKFLEQRFGRAGGWAQTPAKDVATTPNAQIPTYKF